MRGSEQAANSSTGLNLSFDVVTVKAIVTLLILAARLRQPASPNSTML